MHVGPATFVAFFAYGDVKRATHNCWMRDAMYYAGQAGFAAGVKHVSGQELPLWPMTYYPVHPDALIERSRSIASEEFLKSSCEVLLMIDHDITWEGPTEQYEGDILHLARKCAETKAIVGALVSKKVRGQGAATMFSQDHEMTVGQDGLYEVWCPGSGMTAYHRDVVDAVMRRFPYCAPGMRPGWMTTITHHPYRPGELLHMSEDWAFVDRAMSLGYKAYVATRPVTGHIGDYEYKIIGDAYTTYTNVDDAQNAGGPDSGREASALVPAAGQAVAAQQEQFTGKGEGGSEVQVDAPPAQPEPAKPRISLLYATRGRWDRVPQVMREWGMRRGGSAEIEWIISSDDDDEPPALAHEFDFVHGPKWVHGPNRGCVDAYNRAAYSSSGQVLIQVHDDVVPPMYWDTIVLERLGDLRQPKVLQASDGLDAHVNRKPWLVTVLICTREWARACGWFFCPEYVSVYCDDDVSQMALRAGALVDAKDVVFAHAWGGPDRDETQRRSYSAENWRKGEAVFAQRAAADFPARPDLWIGE